MQSVVPRSMVWSLGSLELPWPPVLLPALGSLDLAWPWVKQKSSSKVVDQDPEPEVEVQG